MLRRILCLLALLLPCLVVPPSVFAGPESEEAAYRERRREGLIRRAKERVNPESRAAGNIDELVKTLESRKAIWGAIDGGRPYKRAVELLGTGNDDGLIREGARLYRWLVAVPEAPKKVAYVLQNPDNSNDRVTGSLQIETSGNPSGGQLGDLVLMHAKPNWTLDLPREVVPTDEPPRDPRVETDARLSMLLTAENSMVPGGTHFGGAPSDLRRPLVYDRELQSRISARFVAVRKKQRDIRIEAWSSEGPATGLQDEDSVRRKEELKRLIEEHAKGLRTLHAKIVAELDEMARMEVALTRVAGGRTVEMETDEAKPDAKIVGSDTNKKLEAMRFHQWVEQQELRLLYITVRRAIVRMRLLEETSKIVQDEELKATEQYQSFESEKRRIRLERMLERVETDAYEMRGELEAAKKLPEGPGRDERVAALASLVALNGATGKAVRLRESIERQLHPVQPAEMPTDKQPGNDAKLGEDEARLWKTNTINLDAKRIQLIRANIETIQAPLVAHLHAVSDERVAALEAVGPQVESAQELHAPFAQAKTVSTKALAAYSETIVRPEFWRERADRSRWEGIQTSDENTFKRTQEGIAESSKQADDKLDELRELRRDLTRLGPRSFQCRVDRNLQLDGLIGAWDDVTATANNAERWVMLRGDYTILSFLRDHWWRLLLCIGLLLGGWFGALRMQKGINRWLDKQAVRFPELRDGDALSLDADENVARQAKERAAAETKAIEKVALEQASGKAKDVRPPDPNVADGGPTT